MALENMKAFLGEVAKEQQLPMIAGGCLLVVSPTAAIAKCFKDGINATDLKMGFSLAALGACVVTAAAVRTVLARAKGNMLTKENG